MPVHDDLGTRMKTFYEQVPKTKLVRKTPVAIRIDGKAFHTFTKGFEKPFDKVLMKSMQETMKYLCENIQGCVLGYTQSDEITLILIDYQKTNSSAWFDDEVQKICSITSSMATMAFNRYFEREVSDYCNNIPRDDDGCLATEQFEQWKKYTIALSKGAMFDARCFNIPKEEVTNLIYWRQLDATRNSIQMVGQANFTQKELQNKSCNNIQDMLILQKGINWNDFPTACKRGTCCVKKEIICNDRLTGKKLAWVIDKEIPIFRNEGRAYIDNLIFVGEDFENDCKYCGLESQGHCDTYKIHHSFELTDEFSQQVIPHDGDHITMYLREYFNTTNWSLICEVSDNDGTVIETPVYFCPICGRKL